MTRSVREALTLGLVVVAPACGKTDNAFAGRWKVDPAKSTFIVRCCEPDEDIAASQLAKQEFLIIDVTGGREHATSDILDGDGIRRRSDYTATCNDGQWYPLYDAGTGKPDGGMVMIIRADPATQLLVGRSGAGRFIGTIMRQVSQDSRKMTMTRSGAGGKIKQILVLDKQ